jgi:general stress protein 26
MKKVKNMDISDFAEIEAFFTERVQKMIWCNVATIDRQNRPRSRIVHPLWEGTTGWITTRRNSHKATHLAYNPYISLAYVSDVARPLYIDCRTEWIEDLSEKQRIWQLCLETPAPLGFDPAPIYKSVDHPGFAVLKLLPWRIDLVNPPADHLVWRPAGETEKGRG